MNEFESSKNCDKNSESIIAFKIFDQCRIKKCVTEGPVISAEDCTCIIMQIDEEDHLGKVILPNKPIYIPTSVSQLKIVKDSFETKKIEVFSIAQSNIRAGYWDVEIVFTFIFKLQLLDQNMNKLKIICCPDNCNSINECDNIKNYILATVSYIEKVTLIGSDKEAPLIASDILFQNEPPLQNTPHILVETKAYFIDAILKSSNDLCLEALDDIYDEPVIYVYITIGIFMLVKLFQLASILVESKGYSIAKPYCDNEADACELFNEIEFPNKDFFPPIKNSKNER